MQRLKSQAEANDIVLLFGDESEALKHPNLARAWAKSGADLRVPAPRQAKKVAMLGSLDDKTCELVVHPSKTKRSSDFVGHLEQLDRLYSPQPGRRATTAVLVLDNGPIHTRKLLRSAPPRPLAARRMGAQIPPELDDIEAVWRDFEAHNLAHMTFDDVEDLNREIHAAVQTLNAQRMNLPLAESRIYA